MGPGRKLLASIISEGLVDVIVRSLVDHMSMLDGKFVMKYKDTWDDLKPNCDIVAFTDNTTNDNGQRKEKIEYNLDFKSLKNILGITLSFHLTLQSKLAPEMDQDEIDEILEQKKVPQSVHKSVISTKAVLAIPTDFGIDDDDNNDEPAMIITQRRFFDRANQLLAITKKPKTIVGTSDFYGLDVLEDHEKDIFFQNYSPTSSKKQSSRNHNQHDEEEYVVETDASDTSQIIQKEEKEEETIFDEEQYYNGLSEDELRMQEEELLRIEEEELLQKISNEYNNEIHKNNLKNGIYEEDNYNNEDDSNDEIDEFMKQVEQEILSQEDNDNYDNDVVYGQSDEL